MTKETKNINYLNLFITSCIIIVILSAIYFLFVNHLSLKDNETRGTFGDLFGGLNTVFSGFAFAGVIITILMQMKELELTRTEMRKSTKAQNDSQIALNLQLKQMQSTTELESVKSIIQIYQKREELDKVEIAKAIFERLTEQIFYKPEFFDLVSSRFQFSATPKLYDVSKRTNGVLSKDKNDRIDFNLINNGPSVRVNIHANSSLTERIDLSFCEIIPRKANELGPTEIHLSKGAIVKRGSQIKITLRNIQNEEKINVEIHQIGDFVRHTCVQLIELNIVNSKINYTLGETMKIITDDNFA